MGKLLTWMMQANYVPKYSSMTAV